VSDSRRERDLSIVSHWLRSYVSAPLPHVGRTGPVCPFVPSALGAGEVRIHLHYGIDGRQPGHLISLVRKELDRFDAEAPPPGRAGTSLASLLVVLPDTGQPGWVIMDEVYGELKAYAVRRGLMIGQFHPACDERAVRNPGFRVSRAPLGLFAARRMAPHDVLFLHRDPRWFASYRERFAGHAEHGKIRDPLMCALYRDASAESAVNSSPAKLEINSRTGEEHHRIAHAALTD
jgi:hypothetical protein